MVKREITPQIVYENDSVLAFEDINPKAPVHVLVIPKAHVETLDALDDPVLAGELLMAARCVAEKKALANGYRVVANCKADSGQEVYHLHLHVLGGRKLGWPPG